MITDEKNPLTQDQDVSDATIIKPIDEVKPQLSYRKPDHQKKNAVEDNASKRDVEVEVVIGRHFLDEISNMQPDENQVHFRNAILTASSAVFEIVKRLRTCPFHENIPGLRNLFIDRLKSLKHRLLKEGYDNDTTEAVLYSLCTFIDEVILSTQWGGESAWATSSLLSTFYNETWGGEKFFEILNFYKRSPAANIDILELLFSCLSLGFQGKYKVVTHGQAHVRELRDELFQVIKRYRAEPVDPLSIEWKKFVVDKKLAAVSFPARSILAGLAVIVISLFFYYSIQLDGLSDPVIEEIADFQDSIYFKMPDRNEAQLHYVNDTLAKFLGRIFSQEIEDGYLAIIDDPSAVVMRINNKGLFSSGGVDVELEIRPILNRISQVLNELPGAFTVIGHTDSRPIRSAVYSSNYELSLARATAVVDILENFGLSRERLTTEGKADKQPISSNASSAGQKDNRRIEILIHK